MSKTVRPTADPTGAQGFEASTTGTARTWTYAYDSLGQVLTEDGPRVDVDDKATYAYDAVNGNLLTMTDAAGHVTSFSNHDAHGRPGRIVDANGLNTDLTYSSRGWLQSRVVSGEGVQETTSYDYDGVGQLKKVSLPDGAWVAYTYDDAHRLTEVADNEGSSIKYTLDAIGNRIKEEVKDPAGNLVRQVARVYDVLNRLQEITGGKQ